MEEKDGQAHQRGSLQMFTIEDCYQTYLHPRTYKSFKAPIKYLVRISQPNERNIQSLELDENVVDGVVGV